MKRSLIVLVLALGLASSVAADEPVALTDIAVDKLLDGVRVTIACEGDPNVSSFVSGEPPAIVLDFMGAFSQLDRDRIDSDFYPVSAVTLQPSEAVAGVRVAIRLHDLVDHQVTREDGLVVVDLGLTPVPMMPPPAYEDPFAGKRLTLYVKDAGVTDVVRMIATQFDLNLLVTQDVKSLVTVRLSDVPLRAGLGALLKAALCNMVEEDNGIFVVKPVKKEMYGELLTKVFVLDHIEATDAMDAIQRVLSDVGDAEESYRRVGDGSGSDRSQILVVSDVPEALGRVAEVLAELDRPVPQVAIEAKFIETTHSAEDRYGIEWTIMASANSGFYEAGKDFAIPITFDELVLGKINLDQMRASLEILAARGNSRVLANPRTLTLDNQTARVSMGIQYPLRVINKDRETGEVTYTWEKEDIPIQLEVTPHVTSDGMITMSVQTIVKAITGWVGGADEQQPIVAERRAETQVTVADGEVVVIGGLVKEEETQTIGKIPLLGDIPILGHLFKKTVVRRETNDLMVFIIPHVMT